jgi:hypothetical protein
VINVSNSTSKNNPPRPIGAPAGPTRPSGPAGFARTAVRRPGLSATSVHSLRALGTAGQILAATGQILATTGQILLSWLAALPGRLGDRLFTMNDTEAYWRDWQIIKTPGGLGRRYRDPRFDLLAQCRQCRGAGGTAGRPCPPCLGTGRITREEV